MVYPATNPYWQNKAEMVLLDNCCTMSKRVQSYVEGVYSPLVKEGRGKNLIMIDEDKKFDTVSGLGSNLWDCTNNFSLECVEMVELAELILTRIPYHHKLKFTKTGSAACEAAVRYARAYTKRERIAYTGYHGTSNVFVNCTPPALGTVYEKSQKFDTMEELIAFVECKPGLACVIVEPLELDPVGMEDRLKRLQAACRADGCLMIFDEIITGWRFLNFTVANRCGIYPDISVLGKALGGGYALGIVALTNRIAEGSKGVFISNTHNGEQSALRAAIEVVKKTTDEHIYKMFVKSRVFAEHVNAIKPEWFTLKGYPARYVWECSSDGMKALIWQQMYIKGTLCGTALFPKLSWDTADYALIERDLRNSIEEIEKGATLHGIKPRPFFLR